MSPEEAVRRLAELLAEHPKFDITEACQALETAGVQSLLAVRTYQFTQLAWTRVFLDGMGIGFSADYLLFDKSGNVVESGKVVAEPYYSAARNLAGRFRATPGFEPLVMTSADFKAVNSALLKGSQAANLVLAPAFISLEPLTAEGASKMNAVIEQQSEKLAIQFPRKKPWWRFW